jgi:hypothetical protein
MTSTILARPTTETTESRSSAILPILGGASFLAAPLLFAAGALTSPPQDGSGDAGYIASLAEDPTLSSWSATFFHYSWVLYAFAAIAAIGLVRGRRGRALTTVGGLAAAFGAIQFTGLLLSDWFLSSMGNELTSEQSLAVFHGIGDVGFASWMLSAKLFGLLGFPVLYAGLARAGVISWWLVAPSLLPMVVFAVVPGVLGIALATACTAAAFVTGWRLVQRGRLAS